MVAKVQVKKVPARVPKGLSAGLQRAMAQEMKKRLANMEKLKLTGPERLRKRLEKAMAERKKREEAERKRKDRERKRRERERKLAEKERKKREEARKKALEKKNAKIIKLNKALVRLSESETLLRVRVDANESKWYFWCPACKEPHFFPVKDGKGDLKAYGRTYWSFDGDEKKPTFQPCLWIKGRAKGKYGARRTGCHMWVRQGKLDYCSDSPPSHAGLYDVKMTKLEPKHIAQIVGINPDTLNKRLKRGWTLERAVKMPKPRAKKKTTAKKVTKKKKVKAEEAVAAGS